MESKSLIFRQTINKLHLSIATNLHSEQATGDWAGEAAPASPAPAGAIKPFPVPIFAIS